MSTLVKKIKAVEAVAKTVKVYPNTAMNMTLSDIIVKYISDNIGIRIDSASLVNMLDMTISEVVDAIENDEQKASITPRNLAKVLDDECIRFATKGKKIVIDTKISNSTGLILIDFGQEKINAEFVYKTDYREFCNSNDYRYHFGCSYLYPEENTMAWMLVNRLLK